MSGGWRTAISQIRPGEIRIRGYDLVDGWESVAYDGPQPREVSPT
jgi:hypothetical protein